MLRDDRARDLQHRIQMIRICSKNIGQAIEDTINPVKEVLEESCDETSNHRQSISNTETDAEIASTSYHCSPSPPIQKKRHRKKKSKK